MGVALLKLVVLGEVPGIGVQLGYMESLIIASCILLFIVLNITLLYQNRRAVRKIIDGLSVQNIDLITI